MKYIVLITIFLVPLAFAEDDQDYPWLENLDAGKAFKQSGEKLSELDSGKYSDLVLLRQGIIFRNLGMSNRAYGIFKSLVNKYPESKYAIFAQEEIKNIWLQYE